MYEVPDYSWNDQDPDELQRALLIGGPDDDELDESIDCYCAEAGSGGDTCLSCGHDEDCTSPQSCHKFVKGDDGKIAHLDNCSTHEANICCFDSFGGECLVCSHAVDCEEASCDQHVASSVPSIATAPRRWIASLTVLNMVRRLKDLRDEKNRLDIEIKKIRAVLMKEVFSLTPEIYDKSESEKPIAWITFRHNYQISPREIQRLKMKNPAIFGEFFTRKETRTLHLRDDQR